MYTIKGIGSSALGNLSLVRAVLKVRQLRELPYPAVCVVRKLDGKLVY